MTESRTTTLALATAAVLGLIMAMCTAAYGDLAPGDAVVAYDAGLITPPSMVEKSDAELLAPALGRELPAEPNDSGLAELAEGADDANPAKSDPIGTAGQIFADVKAGSWLAAFGGLLFFVVLALRVGLGFFWEFWVTKKGGFILAGITTSIMTLATAWVGGAGFSLQLLISAIFAAAGAAGAHGWVKDWIGHTKKTEVG